jgi:hypothetical protein
LDNISTSPSARENDLEQPSRLDLLVATVFAVDVGAPSVVQVQVPAGVVVLISLDPFAVVELDLAHPHEVLDVLGGQFDQRVPSLDG